jgi:hypothetical protein
MQASMHLVYMIFYFDILAERTDWTHDGSATGSFHWPNPHKYEAKSLACLTLRNPLRQLCIRGVEWVRWDQGVLALIILNTIQLMMYDPFDVVANLPTSQMTTGKAWPPLGRDVLATIGLVFTGADPLTFA